MMTRAPQSCKSLSRLQDRRATGVLLMLLFSVVSVDAAYRGVGSRDRGLSFYCEVHVAGVSPRVKVWVGTYHTEAFAALACDVAFFYINNPSVFNLEYSEDAIFRNCKPRSAYESLNSWEERKKFIKAEANTLLNLMSSQDRTLDIRWEDVTVPPLERPSIPVRQRPCDVARIIVEQFRDQAEQLREFMAWLMRLSNAATLKEIDLGRFQMFSQQRSEERISQSDIEEDVFVGVEQFLDASRVTLLLDSVRARSGGVLWLALIASSLPLLFRIFSANNARAIEDACVNAREAPFTEQGRCQVRAELATRRQKHNQPSFSIELGPEQDDLFTVTHSDVTYEVSQCTGYDMRSKKWRKLPPFSFLLVPDSDPYFGHPYSICGHGGLMCVNMSTVGAELMVFNPMTGKKRPLPPLLFPRHPVLLHMVVDSATKSFRVIVAGSSRSSEEHLSKKMEVFDSRTSVWEEMCDLPGPAFGLSEYQAGVCASGVLYFISFLEGDGGKGVVAFDVENRNWLPNMTCPLPHSRSWSILQLVENNGELYLFYEQEGNQADNTHCNSHNIHRIDVLEVSISAFQEVSCYWRNVVTEKCRRPFSMNPREYMCVGFGEGMLCIFDTIGSWSVVYDVRSGKEWKVLDSVLDQLLIFPSLDPLQPFLP